jgi:hypothetical protein
MTKTKKQSVYHKNKGAFEENQQLFDSLSF